jgi:hypothetical protein
MIFNPEEDKSQDAKEKSTAGEEARRRAKKPNKFDVHTS